jgi:hypothetical protein
MHWRIAKPSKRIYRVLQYRAGGLNPQLSLDKASRDTDESHVATVFAREGGDNRVAVH